MAYNVNSFGKYYDGDNKQRINLSSFALDVINDDMTVFNNPKKTNFINRIIVNYCFDADASIHFALEKEKQRLTTALSSLNEKEKNLALTDLLRCKEKELVNRAKSYESGECCSFRLWQEVVDFLTEPASECEEYRYYKKIGQYLKAIIEEYCAKPFAERELIYFADKVNVIETAVREKRKISVVTAGGDCYTVSPYGIFRDDKSLYNYLVGYSVKYGSDEPMRPMSMRISAGNEFKLCSKRQTFSLNACEKNNLKALLKKRGVQYMVGEEEIIRVVLTETGVGFYNRQLYLRPTVTEIQNGNEYIFNCTPFQAEAYFVKFGKEAYVKEPESLREKMKNKYLDAYNSYREKEHRV